MKIRSLWQGKTQPKMLPDFWNFNKLWKTFRSFNRRNIGSVGERAAKLRAIKIWVWFNPNYQNLKGEDLAAKLADWLSNLNLNLKWRCRLNLWATAGSIFEPQTCNLVLYTPGKFNFPTPRVLVRHFVLFCHLSKKIQKQMIYHLKALI